MWVTVWKQRVLAAKDYEEWDTEIVNLKLDEWFQQFLARQLPEIQRAVGSALAAVPTGDDN